MHLQILTSQVTLRSQEHLDVLTGGIENGGNIVGSHIEYILLA